MPFVVLPLPGICATITQQQYSKPMLFIAVPLPRIAKVKRLLIHVRINSVPMTLLPSQSPGISNNRQRALVHIAIGQVKALLSHRGRVAVGPRPGSGRVAASAARAAGVRGARQGGRRLIVGAICAGPKELQLGEAAARLHLDRKVDVPLQPPDSVDVGRHDLKLVRNLAILRGDVRPADAKAALRQHQGYVGQQARLVDALELHAVPLVTPAVQFHGQSGAGRGGGAGGGTAAYDLVESRHA
mmetsp:Transcript_23438/g.62615  ORF Transcript_23438/g.62615 Transcript_23438/m.62615 type:complete len:243 (-) Transcript_23438:683-1411(-)